MFPDKLPGLAESDASSLPITCLRPDGVEAGLENLPRAAAGFARAAGFSGKAGEVLLLPGFGGLAGALAGLGEDRSPYAHGFLPAALPAGSVWRLEPGDFDMEGAVLGWCLGAYSYRALTQRMARRALLSGSEAHPHALDTARAIHLTRDLVNAPANLLGPAELAAAARDLAVRFGAECTMIEGEALEAEYPTIAAVGAGSVRPPVVACFTWAGSGAGPDSPLLSLCGKGVVFDTGGLDLKPPAAMLRMKKDMGGAALLLGLAALVMQSDLELRLEVRIGCVENGVTGAAMRPLDVLRTRRGLTVEVGNTDAEGRLVLCDLLAEASDAKPDLLIDAATLTGAARVALGPDLPALFANDDEAAEAALRAGRDCHDPVWRLPLHAGYDSWLKSSVADINNVASKPMAGAVVAGLFLQRFVRPGTRWLHVDTYAWNDTTRPGRPEGGEAIGLRCLFKTIRSLMIVN